MIVSVLVTSRAPRLKVRRGDIGTFINYHESHFRVSQEDVDRSIG